MDEVLSLQVAPICASTMRTATEPMTGKLGAVRETDKHGGAAVRADPAQELGAGAGHGGEEGVGVEALVP
ncbi:hypothetical protein AB0L42_43325 [Streptomyces sp. NPDC052287]|uniref:hypothetical protein n=1 Tax=Streptomyces sp. NPDC052287 TaxID=3154950 RepID=UPI0034210588